MKPYRLCILAAAMAVLASCGKNAADADVIRSVDDLKGKPVAVISGSVQDILLARLCPEAKAMLCDSNADTYVMVDKGKSVASISSSLAWQLAKKQYKDLVFVGDEIDPIPIGFGFKKDNGQELQKFNAFLHDYLKHNDLVGMVDGWMADDGTRRMPDPKDHDCSRGHLVFAVSAIIPPYNYVKDGQVSGIEPEILASYAISEHKSWEFVNVAFTGLIAYTLSGKANICAATMCITEERQQSIDFSVPYTYESSILIVKSRNAHEELRVGETSRKTNFFQSIGDSLRKNLIVEDRYKLLFKGLWATIVIALLAALLGTLLGAVVCYGLMHRNRIVFKTTDIYVKFMLRMPQLVLLMVMFYVVFGKSNLDGIWVAVISFGMCFGAFTGVEFRTAVESIDKGQTEAALSMGFGKFRAFWHIVLPQAVQRVLPIYESEFISLIKETSIVGYIAVFDLTKAGDIIRSRTYEAFFPLILVTIIYFVVIWLLTLVLKYVEKKTQPTRKKYSK